MCARFLFDGIRAQSEVIDSLLLVGFITISVSLAGGLVLANYSGQVSDDRPLAECSIEYTNDVVTVTHTGGDPVEVTRLTTRLRNDSSRTELSFRVTDGDSDTQFETGESASFGSLTSETTVLVVTANNILCESSIQPNGGDED